MDPRSRPSALANSQSLLAEQQKKGRRLRPSVGLFSTMLEKSSGNCTASCRAQLSLAVTRPPAQPLRRASFREWPCTACSMRHALTLTGTMLLAQPTEGLPAGNAEGAAACERPCEPALVQQTAGSSRWLCAEKTIAGSGAGSHLSTAGNGQAYAA